LQLILLQQSKTSTGINPNIIIHIINHHYHHHHHHHQSSSSSSYDNYLYVLGYTLAQMITSESIQMMDCDASMEDYSAVDLVGGIQHSYLFLDPTKSNEDNSDLFLKHHLRLSYAQMTVQAKYHRLCFEYFFIALEKDTPVCWVLYFRNFCIKVRKEIKNYNRRSYLNEVAKKYSLDLSNLTDKDVKSILSSEDKDNLNRIDNQVRSMNGSVWHCAATVFAI